LFNARYHNDSQESKWQTGNILLWGGVNKGEITATRDRGSAESVSIVQTAQRHSATQKRLVIENKVIRDSKHTPGQHNPA